MTLVDRRICPHCGKDLSYSVGPDEHHPEPATYSRLIGIEVRDVYDGILVWHCPECHVSWPRFTRQVWLSKHHAAVAWIERDIDPCARREDDMTRQAVVPGE